MENETTTTTALETYRAAKAATAAATKALNDELTALKARIAEIHAELGRKPRTKKAKPVETAKTKEKGVGR